MTFPILFYIAFLSYVAPVLAGGRALVQGKNNVHRLLFFYSLFMFILLLFEFYLASNGTNNHFVININFLVEIFFILLLMKSNTRNMYLRLTASIVFLALMILWFESLFTEGASYISDIFIVVSRLTFIGLSLVVIAERIRRGSAAIYRTPFFWVAFGILSYYSGTILVTGLFQKILEADQSLLITLWSVNWVLATVGNVMFTVAFFFGDRNE